MKVLDKTVQMNEEFKPVLLITLELPLTLDGGFYMKGSEFMNSLYEAIKTYEDQQTVKEGEGL